MGLRTIMTSVVAATSLVGAVGVGYALGHGDGDGSTSATGPGVGTSPIALANADLTVASSCDALLDSYVQRGLERVTPYGWEGAVMFQDGVFAREGAPTSALPTTSRSTSNESGTNVQEFGVDEPDVVKVAGNLLVRLQDGVLKVYDVSGNEPTELSSTPVADARGTQWLDSPGGELLLVDGLAVVFGTSRDGLDSTITTVDLSDPTSPSVADVTAITGQVSAARLHGDVVRAVIRTPLPALDFTTPHGRLGEMRARLRNRAVVRRTTLSDWLPTTDGAPVVDCADVAIPDDEEIDLGTTTVLAFDPADPQSRESTAVATDAQTSYFSADRFYLAGAASSFARMIACSDWCPPDWNASGTTQLFAFALDGLDTTYVSSGEIEGTIADRWAMDSVEGSLRIAVGASSATGNFNSVLTLREEGSRLKEEGRVDKLGIDEQIKSVRWFDDLAIVVTFRQTDPLYAVDLTDPSAPRLLGKLEIPGFSEYLHPLGEHRLIGVGQDASRQGVTRGAQAALFDVTDLTQPRQIDVVRYAPQTQAGAATDPRQFTWLPEQRTVLTVVSKGWTGTTGWVSVLSLKGGSMTNRMVEVEHGSDVAQVRLVPLASGKVALVTGEDVTFFDLDA